jgi:transcriptional regulator with XRE-family HTH domain
MTDVTPGDEIQPRRRPRRRPPRYDGKAIFAPRTDPKQVSGFHVRIIMEALVLNLKEMGVLLGNLPSSRVVEIMEAVVPLNEFQQVMVRKLLNEVVDAKGNWFQRLRKAAGAPPLPDIKFLLQEVAAMHSSRKAFAANMGVTYNAVLFWMQGKRKPSYVPLMKMRRLYEYSQRHNTNPRAGNRVVTRSRTTPKRSIEVFWRDSSSDVQVDGGETEDGGGQDS